MKASSADSQPQLFGHPVGLYVLFFTELWERFSYYGMRAILVLYLTSETRSENPGMGWLDGEALALYGWYTMLVYLASIPGGIIADKILGQKKAVMWGGLLLCAGHGILAVEALWAFYLGLGLIIAGVGMLKPNISTMVGGLYAQGDERRDKGFTIFYIGINVGAFLSALIVGYVGENIGWHYGFGLAGIGMLIGQIVYMWGQKYLKDVGNLFVTPAGEESPNLISNIFKQTNALIFFLAIMVVAAYMWYSSGWAYGLLFIGLALAAGIATVIYNDGNQVEKDRTLVIYLSFILIIVFWGAFEQAGGLMNLYAEDKTNRMLLGWEVPASWFQSVNAFFIITLGTAVAGYWFRRKMKGKEASSLFKMALGVIIMGLGFLFMSAASLEYDAQGSSAMFWLILAYLLHTIGELCASPVALSFITKLAPVKYASFMMGAYFAATGLGNKVAGTLGEAAQSAGDLAIFTGIAVFCTIVGLIVIFMLKPLKRLTHGVEDLKTSEA